jgi:very-short-patch-repair endonuclease
MEEIAPNPPRNGEGDHAEHGGGGPRRINPHVLRIPIKQVKRARTLRKKMSLPEVLLWQQLRKRPEGLKFRKQFPFGEMTVDFACLERRLIIEVDGEGHSFSDQPRRDAARDALLRREGFRVIRIAARDVLKDMDSVLRYIVATCSEMGPLHHDAARRGPPPRSGEDL